jgi:hypothetical protein
MAVLAAVRVALEKNECKIRWRWGDDREHLPMKE